MIYTKKRKMKDGKIEFQITFSPTEAPLFLLIELYYNKTNKPVREAIINALSLLSYKIKKENPKLITECLKEMSDILGTTRFIEDIERRSI